MRLKNFTFILTADCNYNCSYCMQKKEKSTITQEAIDLAIDFFYPRLDPIDEVQINFYGGEPLLAFEQLKGATLALQRKNKKDNKPLKFSVTTNGSLLNSEILDFFNRHRFHLTFSFDGLTHDMGRRRGSRKKILQTLEAMPHYPDITHDINSVFSPRTIAGFFASMRFMIQKEMGDITFNISSIQAWSQAEIELLEKELQRLVDYSVSYFRKHKKIPVRNFLGLPSGRFHCSAGKRHMALTPEGDLWGCFLFYDYFKTRPLDPQYGEYSFGALKDFVAKPQESYHTVAANYSGLRQDFFQVDNNFCFLCKDIENCMVCPLNAAYSSGSVGKITCTHCHLVKIQERARQYFQERIS